MSHLRFNCINCQNPKAEDATTEPYCADCTAAVDAVRKQADEAGWGKSLYDMARHEALRSRVQPLGMGAKRDPRTLTDRFDTTALRARFGA